MDRRAAFALLTGISVALLFAAIATSGSVQLAERAPSISGVRLADEDEPNGASATAGETDLTDHSGVTIPRQVEIALTGLLYVSLAVLVVMLVVFAWRHRPRLRWRTGRENTQPFDVLDDVAAAIAADADAQRAALRRGTPRNAIVDCWLRLERAVVSAGVAHHPADTSAELTMRVLTTLPVDHGAIQRLAELYREARFSEHPISEEARSAAIDALDEIHEGLAAALAESMVSP